MSSTKEDERERQTEARGQRPQVSVDLLGGLVLLAIVTVYLVNAGPASRDWIFPIVLSYALGAVGVYLVIRGLLGRGKQVLAVPPVFRGEGVDVAVFLVLTVLYVVLVRPVGYWLTTALMVFAGAVYLDTRTSRRNVIVSVVVALLVSVVGFLVFTRIFYVSVPRARWVPWF